MDIAVVLNAHSDIPIVLDTLDAISLYATKNILVVVDGVSWDKFKDIDLGYAKVEGFRHGVPRAPYRNVALGLKTLTETWPDAEWYCYTEYDTLFTSERFQHNLHMAIENNIWMLGNDGHVADAQMSLVESLIGDKLTRPYYLLGCCQFFHRSFIKKLEEIDFFNRFLSLTNCFTNGYFPFYNGYDISEHMYPTLCRQFGGNIGVFASYDPTGKWHGSYEYFPMRWQPEINFGTENFPDASIIHPLKTMDHPLRVLHREKRQKIRGDG